MSRFIIKENRIHFVSVSISTFIFAVEAAGKIISSAVIRISEKLVTIRIIWRLVYFKTVL